MFPARAKKYSKCLHPIELKLRDIQQFFNTMDPSPFFEKDLDADAEEYIVSWVREFPVEEPAELIVYLSDFPSTEDPQQLLEQAMRNYFTHRVKLNRMEFRQLMKQGRQSLVIGLTFLAICLTLSSILSKALPPTLGDIVSESLTIAGWVAMWRPMEIYLYQWWPLRHNGKIFDKLSKMKVAVKKWV
ncbi:MAG: hypothetical protein ABSH22_04570 [Tepidisphaeraceae bacterium]|jgi:hypothetical protein